MKTIIAWTGGTRPAPLAQLSRDERPMVRLIFRTAMNTVWGYWGDYRGIDRSVLDQARTQWKRARYDAHATFRH